MKHLRDTLNVILPFIGVGILIFVIFSMKIENCPEEGVLWENKNCPFHPNKECTSQVHVLPTTPEKEKEWEDHRQMWGKPKLFLNDPALNQED